jgi:putative membrane protein
VAAIMPGITIENFWIAIVVSIILGFVQFGASILAMLLFPFTAFFLLLTLGVGLVFINAGCIMITSNIVGGFHVASFWSAFWFGLVYTILKMTLLPHRS